MLKAKQIVRKLRGTDGAEIAEAAVVLPLVFMLLLGAVWFGRAFNIYSTIQQAAQQGAITAARASCGTCGNTAPSNVVATITAVMQASNLTPSQVELPTSPPNCAIGQPCTPCPIPFPPAPNTGPCSSLSNMYVCQNVILNPAATGQPTQCGSVVSFQYPFTFYLPFTSLNLSQITMTAQAQSRMED